MHNSEPVPLARVARATQIDRVTANVKRCVACPETQSLTKGYFRFCVIWFAVSEIFFKMFDSALIIFDMRSIAI